MRNLTRLAIATGLAALVAMPAHAVDSRKVDNFEKLDWQDLRAAFNNPEISVLDHMKRKQRSSVSQAVDLDWLPLHLRDAMRSLQQEAAQALKFSTKKADDRSAALPSAPELSWGWNAAS